MIHLPEIVAKLRHRQWRRQTLHFDVADIEPASKSSMPDVDKLRFQEAIRNEMLRLGRRPFRSQIVVRLEFDTTRRSPPHLQSLAKNILDLLGASQPGALGHRSGLAYIDDSQIAGLSVSCSHGELRPKVKITITPLRGTLEFLSASLHSAVHDDEDDYEKQSSLLSIDRLSETLSESAYWKEVMGQARFNRMVEFLKHTAQRDLLVGNGFRAIDLARLCGPFDEEGRLLDPMLWDNILASSSLSIRLSEPPQSTAQAQAWRNEIESKVDSFVKNWSAVIKPVRVPLALEAILRPPPSIRAKNIHDLDNVVRNYLLPSVLKSIQPLSSYKFAFGDGSSGNPPPSTKIGVPRYEIWRLPPPPIGQTGGVVLRLVTDFTGYGGVMREVERKIDRWAEYLDERL